MRVLRTEDNFLINLDKIECFELHSITDFYYEIISHANGFVNKVYTICDTIPEMATEKECLKYANEVYKKFHRWISFEPIVCDISGFEEELFKDYSEFDHDAELYKWFCARGGTR